MPTKLKILSETPDPLDNKNPSLTLEGLCILAVDEQADSRDLIKSMLEEFGAEVVVVTSAREAIAALTESPGNPRQLSRSRGFNFSRMIENCHIKCLNKRLNYV